MRPTKTVDRPRHLRDYEQPLIIDLEPHDDEQQTQAGTMPVNTVELGHKGRSWNKR